MNVDLAVVGAGPGGYVAALRAAQLGMKVACIDRDPALGGTCLRIGCIPSKALLDSSELYVQARSRLAPHGIAVTDVGLDVGAMMQRKDAVVQTLTGGVKTLFAQNRVVHVEGTASLVAPGRLQIDGPERQSIEARHVLIATGSEPTPLPGLDFDGKHVVSSEEALAFGAVPARLLVVGAGAVGLELGSVWTRLGTQVRVVELLDRIVPGADLELAQGLQRALERQGLVFQLAARARGATIQDGGVEVAIESDGRTATEAFDRVLVAVGRRPYTAGLGLDALGIARDAKGRITVDERYQTSVDGVYAIGDVIAGPMLAHKAEEEGLACVERIAGQVSQVNYEAIPSVVYTAPELASVGRTEQECRAAGLGVRVGTFPFLANGRARAMDETDGLVKIVADARTDRLLGVHILGPGASELIAEAVLAIEFGASAEDLARTCHAHPTLSEAVREAALVVEGRGLHRFIRPR
jgi:dihydrolipoamide dehydrogenase